MGHQSSPDDEIRSFLTGKTPFREMETRWAEGTLPLRIRYFRSIEHPPEPYVTSVRCLVFQDDSVLVVGNREGGHILPGGRREAGETYEQTLRREVIEETGWTIEPISRLGFIHLEHLGPKPPGYRFPYPQFFQIVYTARATRHVPHSMRNDDYEEKAAFVPIRTLDGMAISEAELGYVRFASERA